MRLVIGHQHLDPGQDQEHGKDIKHPVILRDNRRPKADHDAAQHDHAQDAPEQHPVLILARHREKSENQRDDKDIVQGQRLFHDKGCQVLRRFCWADLPPDKAGKAETQRDIESRHLEAFRNADLVVFLVKHPKVQHQQAENDCDKDKPHPDGLAEPKQS